MASKMMLRACGLALAALAEAHPDALAMVQGAMRLRAERAEPSSIDQVKEALKTIGPVALGSETVAVRLPDSRADTPWGEDKIRGLSVKGISKDGFTGGTFVSGGTDLAEKAHALYGMGYQGLQDNKVLPSQGGVIGAAKVTPGEMEMVGAVPSKDGSGLEYGKFTTKLSSGHMSGEELAARLQGKKASKEKEAVKQEKQQQETRAKEAAKIAADKAAAAKHREAVRKMQAQEAAKAQKEAAAREQDKEQEQKEAAARHREAVRKQQEEEAAKKEAQKEAAAREQEKDKEQKDKEAAARHREAVRRQKEEEEQAATKRTAEETAAKKKADEEVAAKKKAEEAIQWQVWKSSEEMKKAKKVIDGWFKSAAEKVAQAAHDASTSTSSKAQEKKVLEEVLKKMESAKKAAEAAKHKADKQGEDAKKFRDILQKMSKAAEHAMSEQHNPKVKAQAAPKSPAQHKPDQAHAIQDVLRQMKKAAEATMSTPGSRLPALLQTGSGILETADNAEVAAGKADEDKLTSEDAEGLHRSSVASTNEAVRRISAAKDKLLKAKQTIEKGQKRAAVLEKENATAVEKLEHAHAKRTHYAAKARSFRLQQAEVETLKGKHVKFDATAYVDRVKKGNFSRYGLWTTSDEKQHFGEKTWDILSNHIFGLDKLNKNLNNATSMESKAKQYKKIEAHYAAQVAAAEEELLDIEAKTTQAEKDVEEAEFEIAHMNEVKSEQKAKQRAVRKQMAAEKAGKKHRSHKKRAPKKAKQDPEEDPEEDPELEEDSFEAGEDEQGAEDGEELPEGEEAEGEEEAAEGEEEAAEAEEEAAEGEEEAQQANLLQIGATAEQMLHIASAAEEKDSAAGAIVDAGSLGPQAEDTENVHRKAVETVNDAVSRIAAAKEKMQKAQQYLQSSKKRVDTLEEENATANTRWEHAHWKREGYAAKAASFRLKQAEIESLKGKHVTFDKAAYAARVKKGNLSRYGLYTTSDEKQHFGEKTWDILSNHIFGLDKLNKNINNATEMEAKAKVYLKREKQYAAQSAAAQEELLDIEAKTAQAEKDIEDAKAEIEAMTAVKTEQKAAQKEAKKKMAMEKRGGKAATRKRKPSKKAAAAKKATSEEAEAEDAPAEAGEEAEEAAEGEQAEEEPAADQEA